MTNPELDSIVQSAREAFAQAGTPADLENAKAQLEDRLSNLRGAESGPVSN